MITGLIKANIPSRIAFAVSSQVDSRTILDQVPVPKSLLGMGDMLYMASGTGLPIRVHGAFVSDDEVHRVVSLLEGTGRARLPRRGARCCHRGRWLVVNGEGGEGGEKDPMYDQAVQIVLKDRKASISYVQRKLRIGYNRLRPTCWSRWKKPVLVSALTSSGERDVLVPRPGRIKVIDATTHPKMGLAGPVGHPWPGSACIRPMAWPASQAFVRQAKAGTANSPRR